MGMGEAAKGYEPPKPVPPVPSSGTESNSAAMQDGNQVPGSAYGTFSDSSRAQPLGKQQIDLLGVSEDFKEGDRDKAAVLPEPHPVAVHQLLQPTSIDTDID